MLRIAIRFILFDKPKSIGAVAGTVLSVFLIGQQSGIFIFLTNAMASIVRNNSQYIWVTDDRTTNVAALSPLDMRKGREIESVPGVKGVYPLVMAAGSAKFSNGITAGVSLIGVEAGEYAGGPWNLSEGTKEAMLQDGAIITEFFDKKNLGNVEMGEYFEVNGKKVFNAGRTKGVRAFGAGAYTFMTIERARAIGNFPANRASAFLVKWDDGITPEVVRDRINATLPGVKAWIAEDFAVSSIVTVLKSSGIAISVGTLIIFALIVGLVIIGLTLYSAAIDRLRDYGTLKAIGATNGYITRLIVSQALIFAILGFSMGSFLLEGFRNGIANAGTIFNFPLWLRITFFSVTLAIALFGSLFAIRRISKLEPAAIFRG